MVGYEVQCTTRPLYRILFPVLYTCVNTYLHQLVGIRECRLTINSFVANDNELTALGTLSRTHTTCMIILRANRIPNIDK